MVNEKYTAICNLSRKSPSGAEDASYRVQRSHLNQPSDYSVGDEFECTFLSNSGLWLKDSQEVRLFVPLGEISCFELVEGED